MKCQLKGYNLKAFAKGIRLFAKLSNEVLVIADNNKLKFQAVNDFKTVFIELQFERNFFATYECETETKCKLFMKSLVLAFRTVNIEKVVNSCNMMMSETMPRVIFEMNCRNEVRREYYLPYMESNHLRYSSSLSQTNPSFKVEAKTLNECLLNFSTLTKDVSVWLTSQQVMFKSYYDDGDDQDVTTSFAYKSTCFQNYNINNEISVTFNLKDLRNFVDFSNFGDQTISCYFEASGRPIEFTINMDGFYSARMMLATHDFPEDHYPVPPSLPNSINQSMNLISSGDISITTPNGLDNNNANGRTSAFSSVFANSQNQSMNIMRPNDELEEENDVFNPDDDEILESAASQIPPTIKDHSIMNITVEDVERMSPEELERFHMSIFHGDGEDSDNSLGEVLVPDSDGEN